MIRLNLILTIALVCSNATLIAQTSETREEFLKIVDRPKPPLAPSIRPIQAAQGIAAERVTFLSEATERVPGLLVKRADAEGRRPVVIALHETGGSKDGLARILVQLAERGFIAVSIDGRYHGERAVAADYPDAIYRAYLSGKEHPFLYDTVWDVTRLIDYLETREDVDAGRIGLIGFSKGGMETYLTAAVDPRVAVAVPCIGVQSFRWALENNDAWRERIETFWPAVELAAQDENVTLNASFVRKFYDKVVPGIYSQFDGPAMLPLIAPRPLLVINGDSDPLTPRAGVEEAARAATAAYAKAGSPEKFVLRLQEDTGHSVRQEELQEAMNWFVRWLQP